MEISSSLFYTFHRLTPGIYRGWTFIIVIIVIIAHSRRSLLSVCSCLFHPDGAEGAIDPPLPLRVSSTASPWGNCVFHNRLAWSNEVERQRRQREGHLKGISLSTSCPPQVPVSTVIRKAHSSPLTRSVTKVRWWHLLVELWMRSL